MGGPDDTGIIDIASDDRPDTGSDVDAATYVAAAVFNAVSLPPGMPDFLQAAIESRAEQARDVAAEAGFVIAQPGTLIDGMTREDRQRQAADDSWDYVATMIAREERRRREEAWDASRVDIGGVAMSGEDWDGALELLSDPKMRERLIHSMTRTKGWSKDRAEKAADDALTLAQIAEKKKDGTITPEDETKAADITRRNPDAAEMVREAARQKNGRGLSANADASSPSQSVLSGDTNTAATERQGLIKAAVAVPQSDDPVFVSAPNLVSHFEAAREAAIAKPTVASAKPILPQLVAQLDIGGSF